MTSKTLSNRRFTRRDLLRAGLYGIGAAGAFAMPPLFGRAATALAAEGKDNGRILVVLELSGGNDGLNTLVPYGDDAYYRHRPTIGIKPDRLRKIDEHFGFSAGMAGFESRRMTSGSTRRSSAVARADRQASIESSRSAISKAASA